MWSMLEDILQNLYPRRSNAHQFEIYVVFNRLSTGYEMAGQFYRWNKVMHTSSLRLTCSVRVWVHCLQISASSGQTPAG